MLGERPSVSAWLSEVRVIFTMKNSVSNSGGELYGLLLGILLAISRAFNIGALNLPVIFTLPTGVHHPGMKEPVVRERKAGYSHVLIPSETYLYVLLDK